jgi:hypothetical protein
MDDIEATLADRGAIEVKMIANKSGPALRAWTALNVDGLCL